MRIGIDFDNTIVCYDGLFVDEARQRGAIAEGGPTSKTAIRTALVQRGEEALWTEIQGRVYGERMVEAAPFPGVIEFFERCHEAGIQLGIISHKTQFPVIGPRYDLHNAARAWLARQGLDQVCERVVFAATRREKVARIREFGCTTFVDDLVEVLGDSGFPGHVRPVLFDPHDKFRGARFERCRSWYEVAVVLLRATGHLEEIAS